MAHTARRNHSGVTLNKSGSKKWVRTAILIGMVACCRATEREFLAFVKAGKCGPVYKLAKARTDRGDLMNYLSYTGDDEKNALHCAAEQLSNRKTEKRASKMILDLATFAGKAGCQNVMRLTDGDQATVLHYIAKSDSEFAIHCTNKILSTCPSILNYRDTNGETALHHAARNQNEAVREPLMRKLIRVFKIDTSIQNDNDMTGAQVAREAAQVNAVWNKAQPARPTYVDALSNHKLDMKKRTAKEFEETWEVTGQEEAQAKWEKENAGMGGFGSRRL